MTTTRKLNEELLRECKICHIYKSLKSFRQSRGTRLNYSSTCNKCRSTRRRLKNITQHKCRICGGQAKTNDQRCQQCIIKAKNYYNRTREIRLLKRKQYHQKHKKSILQYQKTRLQHNALAKLALRLRIRLYSAVKRNQKSGSAVRDLGCPIEFLKQHLESKFQPGMTWDNYGNGKNKWSIDHIIPLSSFNLENRDELLKAVHYTNLQPLWSSENSAKCDKLGGII